MANPYSGLSKLANNQYKSSNAAVDKYYNSAKNNMNASTEQTIKEFNQQKVKADQGATLEGRAANADYLKSINPYGASAEAQASGGLLGSGYSESSKTANYNSMQNRVSQARSTAEEAKMNYDNQIAQARNAKNAQMAELAYNTMTTRSNNLNNLLGNRVNIASGVSNHSINKGQLDLAKKELAFNMKQAKKDNASAGSPSRKSRSSGSKRSGSGSKTSSKKSTGKSKSNKKEIK